MLYRPSSLPPDRYRSFEAHALDLRERLLDAVESLLGDLRSDPARQLVYELAFRPGEALPKREFRPKLDSALLVEQVYLAADAEGGRLRTVLEYAAAEQEYFDMLDDLVDGDVAGGRRGDVLLVTQLLLPVVLRRLDRFGATAYWCDGRAGLLETPLAERRGDPTADAYRSLLDRQATLYGTTAGVAALAGGADDAAVERAADLGEAVFRFRQLVLDYEQYREDGAERWNAGAVFDEDEVLASLRRERERVAELTGSYADARARRLRGLVALDVDAWLALLDA